MSKTILITGANRGIGRELARQSIARGDRVSGTARSPSTAAPLEGLTLLQADVTDPASLAVLADGPPIDVLICNAGQYRARGGIDDPAHDVDAWRDVLMTNVAGVFFSIRAVLPRLTAARNAKVAVISSMMGSSLRAPGGSVIYRASKAAATNLAVNLAAELASQKIAVGAYHPGWVQTDMGGSQAAVTVEDSAHGLLTRFDQLSLSTTGCFEDFEGTPVAF